MRRVRRANSCPMCGIEMIGDVLLHVCKTSKIPENDYSWIKVKRYVEEDLKNPDVDWKSAYKQLLAHHVEETTFLIDKINELNTK